MSSKNTEDRFLGSLVGLAVGDALGTTNEFVPQHAVKPIADIIGGGKFRLLPGMWTDDTSMALCLAESIIESSGKFDGVDQQERYYRWYMDGHLSSTGKCFDIGKTVRKHLLENLKEKREFHPHISDGASGNGALMRMCPITLLHSLLKFNDSVLYKSGLNSMTTHPSEISRDCSRYFAALIVGAINGATKQDLLKPLYTPSHLSSDYWENNPLREEVLSVVRDQTYLSKTPPDIQNGAYVVISMEAALWGFFNYNSFEEGALAISNLGDDSDTVAAIFGQLAGAFYGFDGIPATWREKITLLPLLICFSKELHSMAVQFAELEQKGLFSEESTSQKSDTYVEMKQLNDLMESEYALIMRKMDPSPRQYKSIDDFNKDVEVFESKYHDLARTLSNVDECDKQSIFNDFHNRLMKRDKEPLELMISRKSGMGSLFSGIRK
ncbi:ADP-ribosyl glycohydrolase [Acrasis kona]|uniref:ADP-ribosylhydrolase ARH3 n=1 Tax=Acrasis kona TaxID=1008807 RepID=A0AAW2ZBE3_9EUKA